MSDCSLYDTDDIQLQPAGNDHEPTVDELIEAYELHDRAEKAARSAKLQVGARLAALAPSTDGCRTTRVRGQERRVKIEYPLDSWEQGRLKEAWHSFPRYRDEFLTIASLRVRLREYKKAMHESGPADFEMFKSMLREANRGPQGTPRVVIEE